MPTRCTRQPAPVDLSFARAQPAWHHYLNPSPPSYVTCGYSTSRVASRARASTRRRQPKFGEGHMRSPVPADGSSGHRQQHRWRGATLPDHRLSESFGNVAAHKCIAAGDLVGWSCLLRCLPQEGQPPSSQLAGQAGLGESGAGLQGGSTHQEGQLAAQPSPAVHHQQHLQDRRSMLSHAAKQSKEGIPLACRLVCVVLCRGCNAHRAMLGMHTCMHAKHPQPSPALRPSHLPQQQADVGKKKGETGPSPDWAAPLLRKLLLVGSQAVAVAAGKPGGEKAKGARQAERAEQVEGSVGQTTPSRKVLAGTSAHTGGHLPCSMHGMALKAGPPSPWPTLSHSKRARRSATSSHRVVSRKLQSAPQAPSSRQGSSPSGKAGCGWVGGWVGEWGGTSPREV